MPLIIHLQVCGLLLLTPFSSLFGTSVMASSVFMYNMACVELGWQTEMEAPGYHKSSLGYSEASPRVPTEED